MRGIGGFSHAVALMRRTRVRAKETNMATNPTPPTPSNSFGKGELSEELKKQIDSIPPELRPKLGNPEGPLTTGDSKQA